MRTMVSRSRNCGARNRRSFIVMGLMQRGYYSCPWTAKNIDTSSQKRECLEDNTTITILAEHVDVAEM